MADTGKASTTPLGEPLTDNSAHFYKQTRHHHLADRSKHCLDLTGLHAGLPLPPVIHATLPSDRLQEGRVLIIGDVHGCPDELEDLLSK